MEKAVRNTFGKEEKLKSKKVFEKLFEGGQSLFSHPLKLQYLEWNDESQKQNVKAGFSVSKRNFKNAVDRNHIKRQLREAYRLNKSLLIEHCKTEKKKMALLFIYVAKEKTEYKLIEKKMQLLLNQLKSKNGN
jgi:ribonuclease P protein component